MPEKESTPSAIEVNPATPEYWPDLETLFGDHGAYAGCWCMFWRLNRKDFKALKGEGTKAVLKKMTLNGQEPGLLAFVNGKVAGWTSIGPRENYRALEDSRILKRVDDQHVWSIVCFFVHKDFRFHGIMQALIHGAVDYARQHRAAMVESYPIDLQHPKLSGQRLSSYSGYMGIASAFRECGFEEVGRASETQLIMRYKIAD